MELFDPSISFSRGPNSGPRGGFPDVMLTSLQELRGAIQAEKTMITAQEAMALGQGMIAERKRQKLLGNPSDRDTESTGADDSVI